MVGEEDPLQKLLPDRVLEKFYDDALSGPAKELGELGTDIVKVARLVLAPIQLGAAYQDRLKAMFIRIGSRVPEEKRISPPPEVAGPSLEGMRYLEEENPLWQMLEEILTKAIDVDEVKSIHPSFPKIISQLSRDEAVMLCLLRESDFNVTDYMDLNREKDRFENRRIEKSNLPVSELYLPENIDLYYSHLESLNLVVWPVLSQDPVKDSEGKQIGIRRHSRMQLTDFGKLLVEASVPEEGFRRL